jgi:hypothetical protein
MRLSTLGIGFICNMMICDIIIDSFGVAKFNYFAALTALPMFLPFADLGLGVAWLNKISVSKQKKDEALHKYTNSFFGFLTFSFLLSSLFISAISISGFWERILKISDIQNLSLYCALIICSTFLATPFALSFKKLQFENRIISILIIQGTIPVITLCLIKLFLLLNFRFEINLLVPSFSYLFTTIVAFWISGMNQFVRITSWKFSLSIVKDSLGTGLWSIALGFLTVLILQVPRLNLINMQQMELALKYSFSLMLIIPAMSLFSVLGSTKVVEYLRSEGFVLPTNYRLNLIKSLLQPSILIFFGSLFVSIVSQLLDFKFLSIFEVLTLLPVLLFTCIAQFAFVIQTPISNLRRNSFLLFAALFYEVIILNLAAIDRFADLVFLVLLPVWSVLTFKAWKNFNYKLKI